MVSFLLVRPEPNRIAKVNSDANSDANPSPKPSFNLDLSPDLDPNHTPTHPHQGELEDLEEHEVVRAVKAKTENKLRRAVVSMGD